MECMREGRKDERNEGRKLVKKKEGDIGNWKGRKKGGIKEAREERRKEES